MIKWLRLAGQVVFYGLFVAFVGYFATSPAYVHMPPDRALIKLSFSHPGQLEAPCRERSAEELARLAPNMRIARDCARERSPVAIEFMLDGRVHHRELLSPAGFKRDGASTLYRRFSVPAGTHRIEVRLKDHLELPGYNYTKQAEVTLVPGQVFVVDFNARQGGFIFK
ncbi:MAG: hypothetical protein AAB153_01530, partial [Pseudomonadota bacterium]